MLSEKEIIAFFNQKGSGIGDDAAFIKTENGFLLFSSDQLIENTHFSLSYFNAKNLAVKLVERCVSDIYVKGGLPQYALLNLALNPDLAKDVAFIKEFSYALKKQLNFHKTKLIGGDTARSEKNLFSLTIIGHGVKVIPRKNTSLKVGDLIVASGEFGGSDYVLSLLQNTKQLTPEIKNYHLEPKAKARKARNWLLDLALVSMDQSDSLWESLEILAKENQIALSVEITQIPLPIFLKNLPELQKYNYAIGGGEDLAVLAIIPAEKKQDLPKKVSIIGKVEKIKTSPKVEFRRLGKDFLPKAIRPFTHFNSAKKT